MRGLISVVVVLLLSACATTGEKLSESASIGPYTQFSGRLIVMEPKHRWQVTVQWRGDPDSGTVRLTHAATQRIVELAWEGELLRIRDNQQAGDHWQVITQEKLATHGIILPPQQLAGILTGHIPPSFTEKESGEWEGKINGSFLKMKWLASQHRLELMDISQGRKATLIIQP